MICPNCHHQISPGAAFCGNCGFKLTTGMPETSPPVPPSLPQPTVPPAPAPAAEAPQPQFTATVSPSLPQPPAYSGNTVPSQQPQPAFTAAGGYDAASAAPSVVTSSPGSVVPSEHHNNKGKAIASFVLGILGCVGWLIPIVGVTLGVLALIFGTMGIKSSKKVFAIIGIVLAVPVLAVSILVWVVATQHLLKQRNGQNTGQHTSQSSSVATQAVTSPCYSTKIPTSVKLVQANDSCSFDALNQTTGEEYEVKVLQLAGLNTTNLQQAAQEDIQNVLNLVPGSSIASQGTASFAGNPAYSVELNTADGGKGIVDYVYKNTGQGNLVIVLHSQQQTTSINVQLLEQNWQWR